MLRRAPYSFSPFKSLSQNNCHLFDGTTIANGKCANFSQKFENKLNLGTPRSTRMASRLFRHRHSSVAFKRCGTGLKIVVSTLKKVFAVFDTSVGNQMVYFWVRTQNTTLRLKVNRNLQSETL